MEESGIITLTTDFGHSDPYVAMMKGVVFSINPRARIVDITHKIRTGSIEQGGWIIRDTFQFFPEGTVHIGVIDPGVGGKRRPVAVSVREHFFVGPDNGLFWPVIEGEEDPLVIHITEERYLMRKVSSTFHGRDIFAPVGAYITRGVDIFSFGKKIHDPVRAFLKEPYMKEGRLMGEVTRADNFGNLITNVPGEEIKSFTQKENFFISIGGLVLDSLNSTYCEVPRGKPLALIGSSGYLEIAFNMASAERELGGKCGPGTKVVIGAGR